MFVLYVGVGRYQICHIGIPLMQNYSDVLTQGGLFYFCNQNSPSQEVKFDCDKKVFFVLKIFRMRYPEQYTVLNNKYYLYPYSVIGLFIKGTAFTITVSKGYSYI